MSESTKTLADQVAVDAAKAGAAQRPGIALTAVERAVTSLRTIRTEAKLVKDQAASATKSVFAILGAGTEVLVTLPSGDVIKAKAYEVKAREIGLGALLAAGVPAGIVAAVTAPAKASLDAVDALVKAGAITEAQAAAATTYGDPVPNVSLTVLPVTQAEADEAAA